MRLTCIPPRCLGRCLHRDRQVPCRLRRQVSRNPFPSADSTTCTSPSIRPLLTGLRLMLVAIIACSHSRYRCCGSPGLQIRFLVLFIDQNGDVYDLALLLFGVARKSLLRSTSQKARVESPSAVTGLRDSHLVLLSGFYLWLYNMLRLRSVGQIFLLCSAHLSGKPIHLRHGLCRFSVKRL